MANSHNLVVYIGSGKSGSDLRKKIEARAKRKGYLTKKGKVALAPYVVDCIQADMKKDASPEQP